MNHFIFSSNRYWVLRFKLVQFIFFLKHIFDESSSAVSHFAEAVVKPVLHRTLTVACLCLLQVRQMPDIVRNKFLHAVNLNMLHKILLEAIERLDET